MSAFHCTSPHVSKGDTRNPVRNADCRLQIADRNVRVPYGSVLASGSLLTKYKYDTVGRLVETQQGAQFWKFKYDDLGRLTRQKLAEQRATSDILFNVSDQTRQMKIGTSGTDQVAEDYTFDLWTE
ncbi:MAG: RHS repeat domain-containing protein [Pyrinomonadaceae bacterium]